MRLFILGTGSHARKIFHYSNDCGYEVIAFVDQNPAAISPIPGTRVINYSALPDPTAEDCMFVAIGRPDVRRSLMDSLADRGWRLPSLVHTSSWVAPDVCLDAGVLVAAGAVVETGVVIGRGVIIDIGVLVDHDCLVGSFCHLKPGTVLGPRTKLNAEV